LEARKKVAQPAIFIQKPRQTNMFDKKKRTIHSYFDDEPDNSRSFSDESENSFYQEEDIYQLPNQQTEYGSKFPGWDSEDRLGW